MRECVLCETPLLARREATSAYSPRVWAEVSARRRRCAGGATARRGMGGMRNSSDSIGPIALFVFPPHHPCARKHRRVADAEGNHLILKQGSEVERKIRKCPSQQGRRPARAPSVGAHQEATH